MRALVTRMRNLLVNPDLWRRQREDGAGRLHRLLLCEGKMSPNEARRLRAERDGVAILPASCDYQPFAAVDQANGSAERIGDELVIRINFNAPVSLTKQLCLALIDGAKQPGVAGVIVLREAR